jgi:hypothetical protein
MDERLRALTDEYTTLLSECDPTNDNEILESLINNADWTPKGAETILFLAKTYGSFALSNALALASAMNIEDGSKKI